MGHYGSSRDVALGLFTVTGVAVGLVWAWWLIDPTAPQGALLPAVVSAALAANIPLTLASTRLKRALVTPVQRYLINPPVRLLLRMGLMPLGYALLETRGRSSGRPRTTPVGNGRRKDTFWIVAEHGQRAGYVRNIQRCPQVRVRLRQGWRFAWREGTAHLLPDDDPYARQRRMGRFHPLRALNAIVVRVMGSELMTVRIDLAPLSQGSKHGATIARALARARAATARSPRLRAGH
ncbi:nitroreductase/quinone reductase family protein [Streptomyces sp. NPDC050617]|uniref:nitroreductase/quinone reductase family protein n=1 Tax=Streptomyces sp. NPDC050617 TaxID=3154628 RepID=UPI003430D306